MTMEILTGLTVAPVFLVLLGVVIGFIAGIAFSGLSGKKNSTSHPLFINEDNDGEIS